MNKSSHPVYLTEIDSNPLYNIANEKPSFQNIKQILSGKCNELIFYFKRVNLSAIWISIIKSKHCLKMDILKLRLWFHQYIIKENKNWTRPLNREILLVNYMNNAVEVALINHLIIMQLKSYQTKLWLSLHDLPLQGPGLRWSCHEETWERAGFPDFSTDLCPDSSGTNHIPDINHLSRNLCQKVFKKTFPM